MTHVYSVLHYERECLVPSQKMPTVRSAGSDVTWRYQQCCHCHCVHKSVLSIFFGIKVRTIKPQNVPLHFGTSWSSKSRLLQEQYDKALPGLPLSWCAKVFSPCQRSKHIAYPLKQCVYKTQWLADEVLALLIVLIEI